MQHSFNTDVAKKYGVEVAIFLNHISYWVNFNKNEDINFHEGRYWTFNKIKSFTQHFPYWSHKQIERIINKCFSAGLLLKSSFNKLKYDRTCWYSLSNLAEDILNLDISRNRDKQIPESYLPDPEIGTTIPDNKHIYKTQIKIKDKSQPKNQVAVVVVPDFISKDIWEEFLDHRKSIRSPMSEIAQKKAFKVLEKLKEEGQDVEKVVNNSIVNGWKGLFPIKEITYGKVNSNSRNGGTEEFDIDAWLLKESDGRDIFGNKIAVR